MKNMRFKLIQCLLLALVLISSASLHAQEADNTFTVKGQIMTRGEMRLGGYRGDSLNHDPSAFFVMGRYQLDFDYKRSWLEVHLSPKNAGVWGQADGSLSLAEAWAKIDTKSGFFVKIGRQMLQYDDGRIIGYDDWTMTAPTHDVLKIGYEGHGHKVHALVAYNQDPKNMDSGGHYYSGGIQPYKTMQTLWYHYETPKSFFGISLLGMGIGMQGVDMHSNEFFYQMLVGSYMTLRPKPCLIETAFYYQMGKEEHGTPLDAFMGSVKVSVKPSEVYNLYAGYDYLSGDKYFAVPQGGSIGLVHHDKIRGFSPIFGIHHQFYGAMDFFYINNYVNGFTPGLQNLYAGGSVNPVKALNLNASYHFFAIATDLEDLKKPLGHEVELSATYAFANFVKLSAGYSFMRGTETMYTLQHVSENHQLHWGWVMLNINPTFFTTTWKDKNKTTK